MPGPDDTMGDLARQDIYPDETKMQPPPAIPASTGEEYAGLGGDPRALAAGIKNWWTNQPSWTQKAGDVTARDTAAYQTGGAPAVIGQLADTSAEQDLLGGFGGNIKDVKAPVVPGALAVMDQYHPPFYSAVERAVQDARQNTAPGQQWAGYLRNQPGVKPEEVETLGLGKLFEQPTVSKDALLGEIAANKVNVGEVVKGGERPTQWTVTSAGGPAAQNLTTVFPTREAALAERVRRIEESPNAFHNVAELPTADSRTKFGTYVLPGGENYREMLLTLPTPNDNYIAAVDKLKAKYGDKPLGQMPMTDAERAYIDSQINAYGDTGGTFKSSHYDEPNILAHIRTNDRVIDGKKTLFVEEVQSDWHQKGKRQGYKDGEPQTTPRVEPSDLSLDSRELDWRGTTPDGRSLNVGKGTVATEAEARDYIARYLNQQAAERNMSAVQAYNAKVPDAPFKTTWPDLAMKRVIREAAEKGYDKVAWTPGSVQAARYPDQLRQHVDNISWSSPGTPRSNPEGLRYVHATPRAGGMDLVFTVNKDGHITEASANQAKGQHVEDIFGKDMARQIMEKGEGEIASKDFVIGAKGMQGFYDEILPATVNRLVKKHGARVTQGEIPTGNMDKFDLGEDIGGRWRVLDRQTQEAVGPTFRSGADAEKWLMDQGHTNQTVHSLDITPSLRAAAMKGFPLFTAGGVAATGMMGDLAKQDDYQ